MLKALWMKGAICTWCSSWIVSPISLCLSDNLYYLTVTTLPGTVDLLVPSWLFPSGTGLITLTRRWISLTEVCRVWSCRISMPNMLFGVGKIKTSYSHGGKCPICSIKGTFLTITTALHIHWWCWGGQKYIIARRKIKTPMKYYYTTNLVQSKK